MLQGPAQLTVRLKGDVFFWITWTTEDGVTLTISELIRLENTDLWTDVLLVNGTEYEPRNNWVSKATADIENGTDVSSVNVTLKGVTFNEHGQYKMRIQGEGQTAIENPSNTAYFTINTYGMFFNMVEIIILYLLMDILNYKLKDTKLNKVFVER